MTSFFDRIMDEIFLMFHYHPLSFPTDRLTDRDLSELADGLANAKAAQRAGQDISRFDPANNPKFSNIRRTGR